MDREGRIADCGLRIADCELVGWWVGGLVGWWIGGLGLDHGFGHKSQQGQRIKRI
ncbi:MAG: hypothetical protein ACPGWR_17515 [Ardenticatenaceae bacterium]